MNKPCIWAQRNTELPGKNELDLLQVKIAKRLYFNKHQLKLYSILVIQYVYSKQVITSAEHVEQHDTTQTGEMPHKCPYCNKVREINLITNTQYNCRSNLLYFIL